MPRQMYEWDIRRGGEDSWSACTRRLLVKLDMGSYWESQRIKLTKDKWGELLREKIHGREQDEWWRTVSVRPKLRTYSRVKKKLALENYLNSENEKGRREMARIRSGTNELRIETGRYDEEEEEERRCWFGCNAVEDEEHFLMDCMIYEDLQVELKKEMGEANYQERGFEVMMGKGSHKEIEQAIVYITRAQLLQYNLT